MGLESATYISGLDANNPAGSDSISMGDDHIKLIKSVLKNTLPNADEAMNGIHASATEPSPNTAGQLWFDTTNDLVKMRNAGDTAWITLLASAGSRLLKVSYNLPASSGYMRNETTYADTNQTITHTTVSTTSTLYITYNGQLNAACNFDSGEYQAWVILANTSGTKIANTTDDIMWAFTDDVDHASNPTWDFMHGVTHTWRVASGDRPTPDSGTTYTFDIWGKIREYDDGGATYNQGSMICMEIEE